MNCVTLFCYWGGTTCDGPDGVMYNKPPNKAIKVYSGIQFDEFVDRIYRATSIDKQQHLINVMCRYPSVGIGKTIKYVLLPVKDNDDVDILFDVLTHHQEVSTLDLYLEVEDNAPIRHTVMASRNHEAVVPKEESGNELLVTNTSNAIPLLEDQLKKKKKTPPSPLPVPEKSDSVGKSRIDVNLKSSLTDSDWTDSKTINGGNGGVPMGSGLLKDEKRQVGSGSNLFAIKRKRSQAVVNLSARRSDAVVGDKAIGDIIDGNQQSDSSDSKHATVGVHGVAEKLKDASGVSVVDNVIDGTKKEFPAPDLNFVVKNVLNRPSLSGVPITSSSKKTEFLSASEGVVNLETDSDSTSDSESEHERKASRKQSFEKIIDERAKQQAEEIMALSSSRRTRRRVCTPTPLFEHLPQAEGGATLKRRVAREGGAAEKGHSWLRFTRQRDIDNLVPLMEKDFESL